MCRRRRLRHPGARRLRQRRPRHPQGLEKAGYRGIAKSRGFIVTGEYGPLREGELERAREWGAELARIAG